MLPSLASKCILSKSKTQVHDENTPRLIERAALQLELVTLVNLDQLLKTNQLRRRMK